MASKNKEESQNNIEYNYYELQLRLKEILYELLNSKFTKLCELCKIDLLITEAKSLIFKNEILYKEYTKRIAKFCSISKTKKYKDYAEFIYKRITEHISNKLKEKDRKVEYGYKDEVLTFLNVFVEDDKNKKRFFSDNLLYFSYPSVLAPNAKLTGIACTESDLKYLSIMPNVRLFYCNIDSELMGYMLTLPDDVDFYISSTDSFNKLECFSDCIFNIYLIASSLCGVLSTLIDALRGEINKKHYKITDDTINQIYILEKMEKKNSEVYKLFDLIIKNPDIKKREDIAKQLHKSVPTIDKHLQKICEYFNVSENKSRGLETVKKLAEKVITN